MAAYLQPQIDIYMANKEQIMETAFREFASNGIKEVSMDDIAAVLKISKKTLYDNFASKDELVVASVEKNYDRHCEKVHKLLKFMPNPLTALVFSIIECIRFYHMLSENFIKEVAAHKILGKKIANSDRALRAESEKVVKDGIGQGYIVRNSDLDMVLRIVRDKISTLDVVKNSENFSCKTGFNIVTTLLQGICTPVGQRILCELRENYS